MNQHFSEVQSVGEVQVVLGVSVLDFVGAYPVDVSCVAGEVGQKCLELVLGGEDTLNWLAEYELNTLLFGEKGYLDLGAAAVEEVVGDGEVKLKYFVL